MIQMDVRDDDVGNIRECDAEVPERLQPDLDAERRPRVDDRGVWRGDQVARGLARATAIPQVHGANVWRYIDRHHIPKRTPSRVRDPLAMWVRGERGDTQLI